MTFSKWNIFIVALGSLALAGCTTANTGTKELLAVDAEITTLSPVGYQLKSLPPAARKLDVAVYNFPDLTGQHKPNENFTEYSRAVTQGASTLLVDSLQRAGDGSWFNVVERSGLQALLQERQLISVTRQQFIGPNAAALPPLRFAGILIEGGVVGYDSNTITGGAGARFLGIGGSTEYRRDAVTVGLRAVSVQTGEVLDTVTTTKTIYSAALQGGSFKYVAVDAILEAEAGITRNEPRTFAVREAIDLAVYALIVEGAQKGLWDFADPNSAAALMAKYKANYQTAALAPQS